MVSYVTWESPKSAMTIQEQVSSIQGGRSRLWLALFWVNHALIQIGLFQVYNRQVCYFKHWTPCTSLSTSARIPTLPPCAALLMIIWEPWKLVIGEKWPDRCAGGESSNKVYWPRGRSSGSTRFFMFKIWKFCTFITTILPIWHFRNSVKRETWTIHSYSHSNIIPCLPCVSPVP